MSCLLRLVVALACLCPALALAAPLPKDPPKGMPHLVVQIKSIDGILADYKHVRGKLKDLPDPLPEVEQLAAMLDEAVPGWRKALDTTKPLGGYLTVEADLDKSRPVLMLPVRDEKAFVNELSPLLGDFVEDKEAGYYRATFQFIFSKIPLFLRFKHGYAYLTFEDASALEKDKALPAPSDILLKDEDALIAARFYIEGVPNEVKKFARSQLEHLGEIGHVGFLQRLFMGIVGASDVKEFAARLRQVVDEAKWASLRLEFNRKTDELSLEFNLVPVKETPLGKEIAAFTPRKSKLAGLIDNDTAAGLLLAMGNFGGLKLDPAGFDLVVKEALELLGLDGDDQARENLSKTLLRSLQVNEADLAAAVKKAPSAKAYTLVVAAKLNDAPKLGLAILGYVQSLPKEKRERFTPAALKLEGGVAVHRLKLPDLPDVGKALFGDSDLYFFIKDGFAYAAMGEDAVDRLKECLKLEPKEGPQLLVEVTPALLKLFLHTFPDVELPAKWAKAFPKAEKVRILSGKVEGGPVLRVRYTSDIVPIIKMILLANR